MSDLRPPNVWKTIQGKRHFIHTISPSTLEISEDPKTKSFPDNMKNQKRSLPRTTIRATWHRLNQIFFQMEASAQPNDPTKNKIYDELSSCWQGTRGLRYLLDSSLLFISRSLISQERPIKTQKQRSKFRIRKRTYLPAPSSTSTPKRTNSPKSTEAKSSLTAQKGNFQIKIVSRFPAAPIPAKIRGGKEAHPANQAKKRRKFHRILPRLEISSTWKKNLENKNLPYFIVDVNFPFFFFFSFSLRHSSLSPLSPRPFFVLIFF